MSATLEFLMAHEAGVTLPTISFLVKEMLRPDKEEAASSPVLPQSSVPDDEKVVIVTSDNNKHANVSSSSGASNSSSHPQHHPQPPPPNVNKEIPVKQLSVDAVRQGGVSEAAAGVPHQRMAIGGLPPPSPYAPLQRARQQHRGAHEDPNFHHHGRGGASTWQQEDGTLSGTTTYVDRWFEKLFFRTPLVVGGGGDSSSSDHLINVRGGVGRPPSAMKSNNSTSTIPGDHPPAPTRPLSRTSGHRSTSSAARRLRCELFAERAAEVLRSNHPPSRGPSSINSSYSQMPLPSSSVAPTGGMDGNRCAYGEAMEDYSAVSPVRRVFQSSSTRGAPSRPSSSMGVVAGGEADSHLVSGMGVEGHINITSSSSSKPIVRETKVRSRVDDAIAAAHRIRSGSARNSRPSSRLAPRTDDC